MRASSRVRGGPRLGFWFGCRHEKHFGKIGSDDLTRKKTSLPEDKVGRLIFALAAGVTALPAEDFFLGL